MKFAHDTAAKNKTFTEETENLTKAMCYCVQAGGDFQNGVLGCVQAGTQCEWNSRVPQQGDIWKNTSRLAGDWCGMFSTIDPIFGAAG
jgi:uncharacterized membrane protein